MFEWLGLRIQPAQGTCSIRRRHVIPTAGSKEGVYIIAMWRRIKQEGGRQAGVALPNPFYQGLFLGGRGAVGALEPCWSKPMAETGFLLPDFPEIDDGRGGPEAGCLSLLTANPQGCVRQPRTTADAYRQVPAARCRAGGRRVLTPRIYTKGRGPVRAASKAAGMAMDATGAAKTRSRTTSR